MFEVKLEGWNEACVIYQKQLPFAMSLTLNKLAQMIKEEEVKEMQRVFNNPTNFTLKSLKITPSKKATLQASVWFKDPPRLSAKEHFLVPQVYGGSRELKRYEALLGNRYLMPGKGVKLNKFGNLTGARIVKILSEMKAFEEVGFKMNKTRSKSKKESAKGYFGVTERRGKLAPGVWQRKGKRKVKPILIATKKPSYRKRFNFYEVAMDVVEKNFDRIFQESLAYAISTAR